MAIKIFIDAGHNPSGPNTGAVYAGVKEQDITYQISQYLNDLLIQDGRFETRLSRPTPDTILGTNNTTSLRERVNMANSWGADYFLSIHTNASTNSEANGTEVYVFRQYSPAYDLAERILPAIVRRVGTRNRGVRINKTWYVLRRTQMPALLIELAYLSNPSDREKLVNDGYQFAYGIYEGMLEYFGL